MDQRKTTLAIASLFISGSALFFSPAAFAEPAQTAGAQAAGADNPGKVIQSGHASWYGPGLHGRKTASGETFNTNDLTAAHRTLPFGTRVRVVNQRNGQSVVVRINDRGPFAKGRVIDLSRASAQAIGLSGEGSVSLAHM